MNRKNNKPNSTAALSHILVGTQLLFHLAGVAKILIWLNPMQKKFSGSQD
jgi:hypothetical protein